MQLNRQQIPQPNNPVNLGLETMPTIISNNNINRGLETMPTYTTGPNNQNLEQMPTYETMRQLVYQRSQQQPQYSTNPLGGAQPLNRRQILPNQQQPTYRTMPYGQPQRRLF